MTRQPRRPGTDRAERAARMQREREAADRRRRGIAVSVVAALVVALVVVGGVAILSSSSPGDRPEAGAPAGSTQAGGFRVGDAATGGAVPVVIYEDFMCPVCGQLESSVGGYLEEQVGAGAITLEYRPIAFLDRASTTDYPPERSTRRPRSPTTPGWMLSGGSMRRSSRSSRPRVDPG